MDYKVIDEKGVAYLTDSQEVIRIKKGGQLREATIDKFFRESVVKSLVEKKRLAPMKGEKVVEVEDEVDPLNDDVDPLNDDVVETSEEEKALIGKENEDLEAMEKDELVKEAMKIGAGKKGQLNKMEPKTLVMRIKNKRLEILSAK